jgi:hypothetical protein
VQALPATSGATTGTYRGKRDGTSTGVQVAEESGKVEDLALVEDDGHRERNFGRSDIHISPARPNLAYCTG